MDSTFGTPVNTGLATDPATALAGLIDRIEATLDAETAAFTNHQPIDLAAINQRKRQGLLELSRLGSMINRDTLSEAARERLVRLSQKLERNRSALHIQIRAVGEVADIVAATMREAESDGTYSISERWS